MSGQGFDLAIFGGGIAGLWTLARLRRAGFRACLLEARGLGGVQSIASQGILHGGVKYALTGQLSGAAQALAEMPGRWRAAIAGQGEIDLRGVRRLADYQYLWSSEEVLSRLTGFFASHAMRSRMAAVEGDTRPELFRTPAFHGSLYRLEEPILDLPSLIAVLAQENAGACFLASPQQTTLSSEGDGFRIRIGDQVLSARRLLFTAGAGNRALLAQLNRSRPAMQTRPLQMVMVRGELPALFGHCLGVGANPRLTVTSHHHASGERVWYLGGDLAEQGVGRPPAEQIAAARTELHNVLPWVDLTGGRWATLNIDRAEVATPGGKRPDDCFLDGEAGVYTAWPTKLVFAPRLADQMLDRLGAEGIRPSTATAPLPNLPFPPIARPPWEEVLSWN